MSYAVHFLDGKILQRNAHLPYAGIERREPLLRADTSIEEQLHDPAEVHKTDG